jgi:hypothetical protein
MMTAEDALMRDIAELRAEIAELKKDAYRYRFIRSTVVDEAGIAGYDKSVDEHIRKRNESLN